MSETRGSVFGWGVHVPRWRLDRTTVAAVAGGGGGKGTRAVASFDEDATTMAVAAGRKAMQHAPDESPDTVWLTTVSPPYLDKTNATAVHAALHLGRSVGAYDVVGSMRSWLGALRAGVTGAGTSLVIGSDVRTGKPGSTDETNGGDAAVALLVGESGRDDALADIVGWGTATEEFLDRWRTPGDSASRQWEERFGETRYVPLAKEAYAAALADAGLTNDDVDTLVVVSLHERAAGAAAKALGRSNADLVATLAASLGTTGAAHPALALVAALESAVPGDTIALVVLADGAECVLVRATKGLADRPSPAPVLDQLEGSNLPYGKYLAWRGHLPVEPPRRPEPARPSASASGRSTDWKFGFIGSADAAGEIHLPPSPFDAETKAMAETTGTITTFTVDRLAYSPNPPVLFAVVDFDGGGRLPIELTDVTPDDVAIGDRVEMTFRKLFTADGIHNYFWKARPIRGSGG